MSIFASILRSVYKLSGAKKAFALPEDALRKEIEKQNRHRGVFTPTDRKAYYETIAVNGFPCLIVREHPKPSERAILYFFGGGMVIGPDKGDLPVMRKLCRETGCDVWFPFYPLCMEHCITETYAMVYECYRKMIELYGGGNVSTRQQVESAAAANQEQQASAGRITSSAERIESGIEQAQDGINKAADRAASSEQLIGECKQILAGIRQRGSSYPPQN
mgnify:CR=1 FL=1